MPFRTSKAHFEQLAERALENLPEEFKKHFTNITISVEDYPARFEADALEVRQDELLGLFRGVEYPQKGGFFEMPTSLPDEIILFQKNIESICSTERDLLEEIRLTLVHEVGHYFGLTEEELRRYE